MKKKRVINHVYDKRIDTLSTHITSALRRDDPEQYFSHCYKSNSRVLIHATIAYNKSPAMLIALFIPSQKLGSGLQIIYIVSMKRLKKKWECGQAILIRARRRVHSRGGMLVRKRMWLSFSIANSSSPLRQDCSSIRPKKCRTRNRDLQRPRRIYLVCTSCCIMEILC